MITSSPSISEDKEVVTVLLKLLMDTSSIVRYRAIDAVGVSPRLTAAFARRLEEMGNFDSNEPVKKAANLILQQVRK